MRPRIYRKFGNRTYYWVYTIKQKNQAVKLANKLRTEGYNARIIKVKDVVYGYTFYDYDIYVNRKIHKSRK